VGEQDKPQKNGQTHDERAAEELAGAVFILQPEIVPAFR
jgi:hypothetical protein